MNFSTYQFAARQTALYPQDRAIEYLVLGMCSEVGEVAGKYKKIIRDNEGVMDESQREAFLGEIGDVLWYIAMLCDELNTNIGVVASKNIDKLHSRKQRGQIQGSGDSR